MHSITYAEENLLEFLQNHDIPATEAAAYAVTLCRGYATSRQSLRDILDIFLPAREDNDESEIAKHLDHLLQIGLLQARRLPDGEVISAAHPWQQALHKALHLTDGLDRVLVRTVEDSRRSFQAKSPRELRLIERLGSASSPPSEKALQRAIMDARSRLRLGVYSSQGLFHTVSPIVRRSLIDNKAFDVQILMFSPELAASIEKNGNLARHVENRTAAWLQLFEGARKEAEGRGNKPRMEIRWIDNPRLIAFHRTVLIDEDVWFYAIHRVGKERGIDAVLYRGTEGESNIYKMLDFYWQTAWAAARPTVSSGRPRLFIGSSSEALPTARALCEALERDAETTLWDDGIFEPSLTPLESLVKKLDDFDFAVLVASGDDSTVSRGIAAPSPRDNVLLELGMFIAKLGRHRTFVVSKREPHAKFPSDLAGVEIVTFEERQYQNPKAQVAAASNRIRTAMSTLGPIRSGR